jgi:5-methylcytosine-specific restriction endonuclease McrA
LPKRWERNVLIKKYSGLCGVCNKPFLNMHHVTIDHVVPQSKGGLDVIENKQPAHYRCNQMKSNMTPDEFWEYQRGEGIERKDVEENI